MNQASVAQSTPVSAIPLASGTDDEVKNSCTFMTSKGDIVITWDETNKEHVLELIRKKMKEGYTFFTTKKYMFGTITRQAKVTERDLKRGTLTEITIPDDVFNKMYEDLGDDDVSELVGKGKVGMGRLKGPRPDMDATRKARSAEEVLEGHSLAVKPIRGG